MHVWIPKAGASVGRVILSNAGRSAGFIGQRGAAGFLGGVLQVASPVILAATLCYTGYQIWKWMDSNRERTSYSRV